MTAPSTRSVLLASALLLSSRASAWQQDRFVVSAWVDPVVPSSEFATEYTRFARANFTTLMGGFGATTPVDVASQVAACAAAGLACIPSACETETGPNPGGSCVGVAAPVMGYQLKDEPQASDFPLLAAWASSVRARAPGALRFINLLPNYGFTPPSSPVYEEYVNSFVRIVSPDILAFDHYPLWDQPPSSDLSPAGYIRNLQVISTAARGANISFWVFFNAMPYNGRVDVSEAQLRWQAYTALAHGAKGLLFFCYWSPAAATGSTFQWSNAIMTQRALPGGVATYVEGPKYAQVSRLNTKLRVYGSFLLRATRVLTVGVNGTGTSVAHVTGGPPHTITGVGGSGAGATWSILLGAFASLPDSHTAAFVIHNQDTISPAIISLSFAPGVTPLELGASGDVAPAFDDSPAMAGFQLALDAGDARVIVF